MCEARVKLVGSDTHARVSVFVVANAHAKVIVLICVSVFGCVCIGGAGAGGTLQFSFWVKGEESFG